MLTFATALFFMIITPGPGVLTTAGVGSAFGYRPGLIFLTGLFIGTNLVALAVVSGLAAIVFSVPVLRTVLLVASAAYLLYLAFRIATAGAQIRFIEKARPPGLMGGIALQAINPKAYAVNTTLFTGFPFWPDNLFIETLIKFAIMNAVWIPVHLVWLWAGVGLKRLDLPDNVQFAINIGMAVAMVLVVALAILP
ncbi:MAG: LysE family translocator [Hyphomicrobiales bacterium]